MRYATAIWNYAEPGVDLADLVAEFAGFGYDAISLSSSQWAKLDDLLVTAHSGFNIAIDDATRLVEWLGDSLHAITFDPMMGMDSRGMLFEASAMAELIAEILVATDGTELLVAVEDFPLDDTALSFYADGLSRILAHPRYGILIDVGHLNMRLRKEGYFGGQSIEDYIRRVPMPIAEVHIHDNDGTGDQHGPLGFGNCDFQAVADALKSVGFDGVSTIEIAPSFHDRTPAESKPDSAASLATWKQLWEG